VRTGFSAREDVALRAPELRHRIHGLLTTPDTPNLLLDRHRSIAAVGRCLDVHGPVDLPVTSAGVTRRIVDRTLSQTRGGDGLR